MAKTILLSVVLGFVSCELIGAIDYLPYSTTRDYIKDALSYPGALISWPFYPQGVHTGGGAPYWGLVAYLGNVVFYAALWFALVSVLRQKRLKRQRQSLNL